MTTDREKQLAGAIKFFADDSKERYDRLDARLMAQDAEIGSLKERVSKLEGQHAYVREDMTGRHKVAPKMSEEKSQRKSEALETLKTVGPWILGFLALLSTLVHYLVDSLSSGH